MELADYILQDFALDFSKKFKLNKEQVIDFLQKEQTFLQKEQTKKSNTTPLQVVLDTKTKQFVIKGTILVWNPSSKHIIGKVKGTKVVELHPTDIKQCIENKWSYIHKRFVEEV